LVNLNACKPCANTVLIPILILSLYLTLSKTWIKICGITQHSDALAACELGADAIGLVFYPPSSRAISVNQIEGIVRDLPKQVTVVALFVDPTVEEVNQVIATGMIDLLQFHGEETPAYCQSFGLPTMKAFRVGKDPNLQKSIGLYRESELVLLDAYEKDAPGGTGKLFDWDVAIKIAQSEEIKLVLAGGLNPDNVQEAVICVGPFGVDVSSGVESSPGKKDIALIKKFIEGVRSVSS
jgi:phosphoribosylanthranilate isomerase